LFHKSVKICYIVSKNRIFIIPQDLIPMNLTEINKKYFTSGTRGYKIISCFYNKYSDLFKKTIYNDPGDFSNQIFLSVSKIDFKKEIRNEEAYIIGTIKIQCRVLLDKAIKSKKIIPESQLRNLDYKENEESVINNFSTDDKEKLFEVMEGNEIFNQINIFKIQLKQDETKLFNYLIDEKTRYEIAEEINLNLNTLDTHIRRLRIKFSRFLKKSGYSARILDKYN